MTQPTYDGDASTRCGGSTGAPRTAAAQNASTIFNYDPKMTDDETHSQRKGKKHTLTDKVGSMRQLPVPPPAVAVPPSPAVAPPLTKQRSSLSWQQQPPQQEPVQDAGPEPILDRLRAALKGRGAVGITGLSRNFRICDTSGDKKLSLDELSKCFRMCKISLPPDEIQVTGCFPPRAIPSPP